VSAARPGPREHGPPRADLVLPPGAAAAAGQQLAGGGAGHRRDGRAAVSAGLSGRARAAFAVRGNALGRRATAAVVVRIRVVLPTLHTADGSLGADVPAVCCAVRTRRRSGFLVWDGARVRAGIARPSIDARARLDRRGTWDSGAPRAPDRD